MIYFKPVNGTFGNGVIRVERTRRLPSVTAPSRIENHVLPHTFGRALSVRLVKLKIRIRRYLIAKRNPASSL